MNAAFPEIVAAWCEALWGWAPTMVLGVALCVVLLALRERLARAWPLVVGAALAAGLGFVWSQASITDDAAITLRYSDHVLRGLGPVWNPGQRVEGITNFGWMLLQVALGLCGMRLEHAALLLSLLGYLLLVGAVLLVERTLDPKAPPLAASLIAVQYVVTAFGTTGLESDAAAGLVVLGAALILREDRPRDTLLAGLCFAWAGLFHLDHLLAGALAGGWLVLRHWPGRGAGADAHVLPRPLLAFGVGLLPYPLVHGWKVWYYHAWLPNTFWAKSGDLWYPSQGLVYELVQALASNHWLLLPTVVAWPWLARGRERALALWALLFAIGWHAYLMKVGGDFMAGRFLIPLIPWTLIAGARTASLLVPRSAPAGLLIAALLGLGARGVSLTPRGELRWYVADENTIYPLTSVFPPVVDHHSFRQGQIFHRIFVERDLHPVLATSGIGWVGFYSDLEVVDMVGLTEPEVASLPVRRRGKPGHEKNPSPEWLDGRGVDLIRWYKPSRPWDPLQRADFEGDGDRWWAWRYDPELMAQIHARVPEMKILRPQVWLRQNALRSPGKDREDALRRLAEYDHYYFSMVDDPRLRERLVARIDELWPPPE